MLRILFPHSFQPRNILFPTGKQFVSKGETNCFVPLCDKETAYKPIIYAIL